jgi:hypothetical protein
MSEHERDRQVNARSLSSAVLDQFERVLTVFHEIVLAFDPWEWTVGDIDYVRPSGLAYHTLETIEFYVGSEPAERFKWGSRFGADWEGAASDDLPTQSEILEYLREARRLLQEWLEDEDLAADEELFPWTGAIHLGRALYLLRHTQHHIAELSLELTRRSGTAPDWR